MQESRQFLTLVDDVCEDEHSEEVTRLFKCLDRDSSSSSSSSDKKKKKKALVWGSNIFPFCGCAGIGQEKKAKTSKDKKEKDKKTKKEKKEKTEKPPKPPVPDEKKEAAKRLAEAKKAAFMRAFQHCPGDR